jgi:hypothetical protein
MCERLECNDFRACLEQAFDVRSGDVDPIPLTLAAVTELGAAYAPGMRRPFALVFLGPESPRHLLQGTYRLENATLGVLDVFIVPLGPQAGRMRYEAVFT